MNKEEQIEKVKIISDRQDNYIRSFFSEEYGFYIQTHASGYDGCYVDFNEKEIKMLLKFIIDNVLKIKPRTIKINLGLIHDVLTKYLERYNTSNIDMMLVDFYKTFKSIFPQELYPLLDSLEGFCE